MTTSRLVTKHGRGFNVSPITIENTNHLFEAAMAAWRVADMMAVESSNEEVLQSLRTINSEMNEMVSNKDLYVMN